MRDEKMLVLQQAGGVRWWEHPGGGLEIGEDAASAAIRETFEETGLRIEAPELLQTWNYRGNSGADVEAYAYVAVAPDGEIRLSEEHSAYAWLAIDDYVERYCGDALVAALPQRADFLLGLRENCELLREWLRARSDA